MWASNSQQPSPTGAESCGSATAGTTFSGGSYTNTFSYTHLGQLWHAPVNGTGGYQQYLYCNSAAPHQLTNIVPAGKGYSCSNLPPTNTYAVGYDNWGNVTSRTYDQQTATLSYNKLDEMVEWQIPNTNQAWYAYDSSGERTLQRTTIGSTTTMTVYAFGLEEYDYDGSGNLQNSTHYYTLGGRLLGELQQSGSTSTTNYFLTDNLGSVLAVFNSVSSSAALLSTQLYAPYGAARFTAGTPGNYTNKGYTGQYNDSVSGLDYYNARYYDPVSGVFLSADSVEGNDSGMNPYAYAGGNPATDNDPSGMMYTCGPGCGNGGSGNQQGDDTGTPPLTTPPSTQVDPNNPLTWPTYTPSAPPQDPWYMPSVGDPALDIAVGAGLFACPVCLGVAAVGAVVLTLATPTNLDPGVLSQPIIPTGPDIQPTKAVNSVELGHTTVSGGGGGKKPPKKPTASPPGEPPGGGKTSKNLFRNGNASSPKFDNVRVTSNAEEFANGPYDVLLDEEGNICAGGQSTYEYRTKPGKWWMLPAGTDIPEGLQVVQDDPTDPTHWAWQPTKPMSVGEFAQLVSSVQGWQQAFTKVPDLPPESPSCE